MTSRHAWSSVIVLEAGERLDWRTKSGKGKGITDWAWDWSFYWMCVGITGYSGTHLIPVTRVEIKEEMRFCNSSKRLVGAAGWTGFLRINPFSAKACVPLVKIAPKNSLSAKICWPAVFVSKMFLHFGVHYKWELKPEITRHPTNMQKRLCKDHHLTS